MSRAILLIDHGSKRPQAHVQLCEIAERLRSRLGECLVEVAHMEIAEPSISQGVAKCVQAGATKIVAIPCLLSRGRHVAEDIPRLLKEAVAEHSGIEYGLSGPLAEHDGFIDLLCTAAESVD